MPLKLYPITMQQKSQENIYFSVLLEKKHLTSDVGFKL